MMLRAHPVRLLSTDPALVCPVLLARRAVPFSDW